MTPAMLKMEALDLELIEIVWRRFNFPWCTGYYPKRYQRGLDLFINKGPEDFRYHQPRPILLFNIEANIHNKYLGKLSTRRVEQLGDLAP